MILQALCELYDVLAADKNVEIPLSNYSAVECSYRITLSPDGSVVGCVELGNENKKTEKHTVPEHEKRSSIRPYFLCDTPKYLLGYEVETDKTTKQIEFLPRQDWIRASLAYHRELIGDSSDEGLRAFLLFLEKQVSRPGNAFPKDMYTGKNLIFQFDGDQNDIHDRPATKIIWEKFRQQPSPDELCGQCLITGEPTVPIAKTHNSVPILGGHLSGCSLVSFKPDSFKSYGKEQSYNAPVSKNAEFKYITALKYLLSNPKMHSLVGETTVVFWATKTGIEQDIMSVFFPSNDMNKRDPQTIDKIQNIISAIRAGKSFRDIADPSIETYVLGLSPNTARLSVRFWYTSTFGKFMRNMTSHQDAIGLLNWHGEVKSVGISQILRKTVPSAVTTDWWEKCPNSFEQGLFNAILTGAPYPISLYMTMLMRIRSEAGMVPKKAASAKKEMQGKKKGEKTESSETDGIDFVRVGYIKAVLCRNFKRDDVTMSLNLKSTNKAYTIGRLFAVLEKLQYEANNDSTIRSRYFASASTNPKLVFPSLLNLAQHHIAKVDSEKDGYASKYYDADISKLLWNLDNEFPATLNLEEQGLFILGYYHQREYYYMKKEDKEKLKLEA